MNTLTRYNEVTVTATEIKADFNNAEIIRFHAFNPNGDIAYLRDLQTEVREAVEAGKAKSGCLFVYSSMGTGFYEDKLFELVELRRVNGFKMKQALEGIQKYITDTETFLAGL